MANISLGTLFTDIADAIRVAENSTGKIVASDFPSRIEQLTGDDSITFNIKFESDAGYMTITFRAYEGMTWKEWAKSDFPKEQGMTCTIEDRSEVLSNIRINGINYGHLYPWHGQSNVGVRLNDTLVNGETYWLMFMEFLGSYEFYIYINSEKILFNTTEDLSHWEEWLMSDQPLMSGYEYYNYGDGRHGLRKIGEEAPSGWLYNSETYGDEIDISKYITPYETYYCGEYREIKEFLFRYYNSDYEYFQTWFTYEDGMTWTDWCNSIYSQQWKQYYTFHVDTAANRIVITRKNNSVSGYLNQINASDLIVEGNRIDFTPS